MKSRYSLVIVRLVLTSTWGWCLVWCGRVCEEWQQGNTVFSPCLPLPLHSSTSCFTSRGSSLISISSSFIFRSISLPASLSSPVITHNTLLTTYNNHSLICTYTGRVSTFFYLRRFATVRRSPFFSSCFRFGALETLIVK